LKNDRSSPDAASSCGAKLISYANVQPTLQGQLVRQFRVNGNNLQAIPLLITDACKDVAGGVRRFRAKRLKNKLAVNPLKLAQTDARPVFADINRPTAS